MPSSRLEGKIQTLLMIKMVKIDTLFMTEVAAKPYPLSCTYLYIADIRRKHPLPWE